MTHGGLSELRGKGWGERQGGSKQTSKPNQHKKKWATRKGVGGRWGDARQGFKKLKGKKTERICTKD